MNTTKMSKSQRRKQRLLNKGKQLALTTGQVQPVRKAAKRRNRKSRSRKGSRLNPARSAFGSNADRYFESLLDPESVEGAKIPDLVAFPSGTFQLTHNGVLTTGTGGDSVAVLMKPIVGNTSLTNEYPIVTFNGTSAGSISLPVNVSWTAYTAVTSAFGLFRPVSASLELYFIGNSTADAGRIVGTCFAALAATPTTYSGVQQLTDTEEWPMREGMKVLWKPLDETNLEYVAKGGGYSSGAQYPWLLIAVTGLPSATTSMAYRVVCNFEAIPTAGYYDLVETSASPYNPNALRKAFEWASEAGNNILTVAQTVGPYVRAGYDMYRLANQSYAVGANTVPNWAQLPQRVAQRSRGRVRQSSLVGGLMNRILRIEGSETKEGSKDEESEEDVEDQSQGPDLHEALQSFSRMQVREKSSSTEPMGPVTSSPGLSRFRKGQ